MTFGGSKNIAAATMFNKLTAKEYTEAVNDFIRKANETIGNVYSVFDREKMREY